MCRGFYVLDLTKAALWLSSMERKDPNVLIINKQYHSEDVEPISDGLNHYASQRSSSKMGGSQNGKYCSCHNMLCKQLPSLAIRTIPGSDVNA